VYSGVKHFSGAKRYNFALEQFRWLIEHLSARIAAGMTLERAFSEAPDALKLLTGEKSELFLCLKLIEKQLKVNRSLDQMLPELQKVLNCNESYACLKALIPLRKAGGQMSTYVRQQHVMLNEQIALRRDLSADNAQRQTEAMIMMVLPYAMSSLLGQSSSLYQHSALPAFTAAGLLLAYSLAAIAAHLALRLLNPQVHLCKKSPLIFKENKVISSRLLQNAGLVVCRIYKQFLPQTYYIQLNQNLTAQTRLSASGQNQVMSNFFAMKMVYILAGILPGITIAVINPARFYWIIILVTASSFLQDQQVMHRSIEIREDEQLAYPEFLSLVLVLLQCGLSLHKTLEICTKNYQDHGGFALNKSLKEVARKITLGIPAGLAFSDLVLACSIPQIQSALLLIERYDRDGGFENLHLLEMQVSGCWSIYRQTAKKQIERRSLLLFVPMSLDLIAILVTAILPAIQTLQSI
ncbi:MAG TPA: hypothetical protein DCM45_05440, partial [Clostridiales bacterium]|nr:hypothetical protein [Clostridiales bacterium]